MKAKALKIIYFLLLLLGTSGLRAQSLVKDANLSGSSTGNTFSETIKIISNSKKIFVLTNNNQQLSSGDFISLALENKLAARALVAKTHQGQVGIKIMKIYSLSQWGKLKRHLEVQIVKGDDSTFAAPVEAAPIVAASKIKSEDDLFTGNVVVEDELGDFEDNKNRHIKPDNVVSAFGGFYSAELPETSDVDDAYSGGSARATVYGLGWAHQFADNYFIEGFYSRAMLNKFPSDDTQTLVNHFGLRLKYNFKGPLFTFFMPYAGFQTFSVSSPDAGKTDNTAANEVELEAVEKLKKSGPAFGVTVLRRLVPGWFIKANIGTDMINLGFAIEF